MTGDLAQVAATCPGWRTWRTRDGALAARKGGTPPGVQARGVTVAELIASIAAFEAAGEPSGPVLRPKERAVLAALEDATGPMTARDILDTSGVALSSTANALAVLRCQGLVRRRRKGRAWLCRRKRRPPAGNIAAGKLAAAADTIGSMPAGQVQRQLERLEV